MRIHCKLLVSATLLLFLSACATSPTQPSQASPTAARSGFLQDYSQLVQDPREPGYQHYVAPIMRAGKYRRRSEEHTSELQSLSRLSYDGFCLQKKINRQEN